MYKQLDVCVSMTFDTINIYNIINLTLRKT